MSSFFDKVKSVFHPPKASKFKVYEPNELKMIAMKTRITLETNLQKLLKEITLEDRKFLYVGQDPSKLYTILQVIGQKVIEAESIKIFVEMMRKVENNFMALAKTNGDISLMRTELLWFQSVLWYRQARQVYNLEQFYDFCLNFFKGVDVTQQLNMKCDIFQIYPILKYLKKGEILPLYDMLFHLQPYVSCNISQPTLEAIFTMNKDFIYQKEQENQAQRAKYMVNPGNAKEGSQIYPNSPPFQVQPPQRQPSIPQTQKSQMPNSGNIASLKIQTPFNNVNLNVNIGNRGNNQPTNSFFNQNQQQQPFNSTSQFNFNQQNNNSNNYNQPYLNPNNQNYQHSQINQPNGFNNYQPNSLNINTNFDSYGNINPPMNFDTFSPQPFPFDPLNTPFGMDNMFYDPTFVDHNPFTQKNAWQSNISPNIHIPQSPPNQNYYPQNSNSAQSPQNKNYYPQNNNAVQSPQNKNYYPQNNNTSQSPQNKNYYPQNNNIPQSPQQNQNYYPQSNNIPQSPQNKNHYPQNNNSEQQQPFIPTSPTHNNANNNQQNNTTEIPKKSFLNTLIRTASNKETVQQPQPCFILPQQEQKYNDVEGSRVPLNFDNQRQQQMQEQQQQRQTEQRRLQLQIQTKNKQRLIAQQLQQERQQKENEQKRLALQNQRREEERKRQKEEEEKRRIKQEEDRRQQQEEERQKIQEQNRIQRQREEKQKQFSFDVFADNEREEIDRGTSGRFSMNMVLKSEFADEQAEQFHYADPNQIDSILQFEKAQHEKENSPSPSEQKPVDLRATDERESLEIIAKCCQSKQSKPFRLFFFKKMQAS